MYGYKINPIKATCGKYGKNCDIAKFNDTCYDICAGFSQTIDPYNMDPNCRKACDQYVEQQRVDQFGVGKCDHQAPYYPVIWNQVPHYVPMLLKNMTPTQAFSTCKQMCREYLPNLVQECYDKCELDFNAIEIPETQKVDGVNILPTEKTQTFLKSSKKSSNIVAIVVSVFFILLFIGIYIMVKKY